MENNVFKPNFFGNLNFSKKIAFLEKHVAAQRVGTNLFIRWPEKHQFERPKYDNPRNLLALKRSNFSYHPTIMIIAHKLSTIQKSDKIIVLDNGRVVGEGTHEELIGKCSVYLEIVRKQLNMIHSTERRKKYSSKMQPQLSRSKSSFKSQSSPIKHL